MYLLYESGQTQVLFAGLIALALALVAYCYVGYPILLVALTSGRSTPTVDEPDDWLPRVVMVVPAHNEADVIVEKLENVAKTTYSGPFECIVVSDSTDDTDRLVRQRGGDAIRLLSLDERRGKSHAVNRAAEVADADVLVVSDANTMYEPGAVGELVAPLADPSVGCATGRLQYESGHDDGGESAYWRYELWLRERESRLGTTVSINGGLLAIRATDFEPLPEQALTDDFVLAMRQVSEGRRVVYVPNAVGTETTAGGLLGEFDRRVRIGAGNYQTVVWFRSLLDPRRGYVALQFFSHKVLRWFVPHLLVAVTLLSVVAALRIGGIGYWSLVAGEALAYSVALLGVKSEQFRSSTIVRAMTYFAVMNAALGWGFVKFLSGPSLDIWTKTRQ